MIHPRRDLAINSLAQEMQRVLPVLLASHTVLFSGLAPADLWDLGGTLLEKIAEPENLGCPAD